MKDWACVADDIENVKKKSKFNLYNGWCGNSLWYINRRLYTVK